MTPAGRPEEYAEYLTLNDTTGRAPMPKLRHRVMEDSDFFSASDLNTTTTASSLSARSGCNRWAAYKSPNCEGNDALVSAQNFGCGGCFTTNQRILSGGLSREGTGNPYPTVDYFSGSSCSRSKIHHQGIYSGQHLSCDRIDSAWSVVTYQGC